MNHTPWNDSQPRPDTDGPGLSHCSVSLLAGDSVLLWAPPQTEVVVRTAHSRDPDTHPELTLGLAPGRLVVVGRASPDSPVPYLDPAYRATPMLPDSGACVLRGSDPRDNYVSRAHFTLCGAPGGAIVLTNGVPRAGGGLRPPRNGTILVAPVARWLEAGEELLIPCGELVAIRLPNDCVLQLKAQ